jgi:hypothetical protein
MRWGHWDGDYRIGEAGCVITCGDALQGWRSGPLSRGRGAIEYLCALLALAMRLVWALT